MAQPHPHLRAPVLWRSCANSSKSTSDAWDLPGLAVPSRSGSPIPDQCLPSGALAPTSSLQGTLQPFCPRMASTRCPKEPLTSDLLVVGACGPDLFREVSLASSSPRQPARCVFIYDWAARVGVGILTLGDSLTLDIGLLRATG